MYGLFHNPAVTDEAMKLGMMNLFCVRVSSRDASRAVIKSKISAYCIPVFGYDAHLAQTNNFTRERRNFVINNYPNGFTRRTYAVPRAQNYAIPEVRGEHIVKVGHLTFTRIGEGSRMLLDNSTLHLLSDWTKPWPIVNSSEELELTLNPNHAVNAQPDHDGTGNEPETCVECDLQEQSHVLPAGEWIISPNDACKHWYNLNDSQYTGGNAQYNTRITLARLMMAIDVKAGSEDMVRFNVAKTSRITNDTGFGMDDGLLDRLSF